MAWFAAVAWVRILAWELLYASGTATPPPPKKKEQEKVVIHWIDLTSAHECDSLKAKFSSVSAQALPEGRLWLREPV